MRCTSCAVPSVVDTSACVSPRVNSAEPCWRGIRPDLAADGADVGGLAAVDAHALVDDHARARPSCADRRTPSRSRLSRRTGRRRRRHSPAAANSPDSALTVSACTAASESERSCLPLIDIACLSLASAVSLTRAAIAWSLTGATNDALLLAHRRAELLDEIEDRLARLVREEQRVDHDVFGELRGAALDHDDGVAVGGDDEVEVGGLATRRRSG